MATLLITKKPSNEYSFIVNGNTSDEILNLRNDLTVVGNKCHFKTSNGANLIKEQNITFSDVTLVATGTFTFVSVYALFSKLKEVGFFDWISGSGTIGGATKFSALDDTFAYFGKAGKAVVVSNDELRLETITIHNYRKFVDLEDTFDVIVPNKMLVTDSAGTGIILRDIPQSQVDNLPFNNRIKTKTGFTLVGRDLTVNPSWEWALQGIDYINLESQVVTFPYSATGLSRIDYVVPNNTNGFNRIIGQESTTPVAPQIPYEGMYVTFVLVTDASVDSNGEPDLSAYATTQYVDGKDAQKVDKVTGKSLLLDTEITRLATLANYTHPANHPPSIITQDASNRFVTDAEKSTWNAKQSALGFTPENVANKNIASGYAGLGVDGKLLSAQLPSITISDTFVTASQAAMLAVIAQTGDVAVRTDLNKTFILKGIDPTLLSDWQELLTPTSAVTTVFGRNGVVTSQLGDYTADQINETATRVFQTVDQRTNNDATSPIQAQINLKAPLASPVLTGTPTAPTATAGTNTTQLATTAFVTGAVSSANGSFVTLTGNETITGQKTFTNASPILLTQNAVAKAIREVNGQAGFSVQGGNASLANGMFNTSMDRGISFSAYGNPSSSGRAFYAQLDPSSTVIPFQVNFNAATTFTLTKEGATTASSFIKSGATTTDALLAGGTTLANPISGTGTNGNIVKWTAAGTQGNSIMQEVGAEIQVNGNIKGGSATFSSSVTANGDGSFNIKRASDDLTVASLSINTITSVAKLNTAYSFLSFETDNIERARFFNGNLLIGSSTNDGFNKLQVTGSAKITSLGGTGSRVVTADASGNLSATNTLDNLTIIPIELGTATTLSSTHNGLPLIITASCTITIPNGLAAGFNTSIITLAGVTVTIALGSSVVLFNNTGLTMPEKLSFTLQARTTTNNYITTGNL